MKIEELFHKYPYRSASKFVPIALEHGFSKSEAIEFLKSIPHDIKHNPRDYYLPIYSEQSNAFQFDTLVQTPAANPRYFLIVININSRRLYAYPMTSKNASSVLAALEKFVKQVPSISAMTSDQDQAYLSAQVIQFMKDRQIDYRTTNKHDHSRLGIINRAIKTLRDLNQERDFTTASMKRVVSGYNNTIHSSTGRKPSEFTRDDEVHYQHRMRTLTDTRRQLIPIGSTVRTVIPRTSIGKRRANLSDRVYIIDSMSGNKYIIRAKDDSIAIYPRHQLVQATSTRLPLADTIDNDSHGIVEKITGYKNRKYQVIYEGGSRDSIRPSYLREGRPTVMCPMEVEFWKGKVIPKELL